MTNCNYCGQEFVPSKRKDELYCSDSCLQKFHYEKNKEKVKARQAAYNSKPETKLKQKLKHRDRMFKKYGLPESDFNSLLERQQGRCLGCKSIMTDANIRMDHDHKTGKLRGLICIQCNVALGMTKDDPAILYNLIAYLNRDPSKTYIYLIGSLKNSQIPYIGNSLRKLGFEVFDQWHGAGPEADDKWQEYSKIKGLSYKEALEDVGSRHVFHFDRSHLEMSDIGILVMPSGKSGHLELGYMSGLGKKTYILFDGKDPDRYEVMPQFANQGVYKTPKDLLEEIAKSENISLSENELIEYLNANYGIESLLSSDSVVWPRSGGVPAPKRSAAIWLHDEPRVG